MSRRKRRPWTRMQGCAQHDVVDDEGLRDPPGPEQMPEGFERLQELAFDLRSSWNHRADRLWEAMDAELWRQTGNPWLVVQTAPHARIQELLSTPSFRAAVDELHEAAAERSAARRWFHQEHGVGPLHFAAFFSLEFMLSEALPLYSGGLGNVAGDYLKAASDLAVPLVGVGLLYQQGYFRQAVDASGRQREFFPFNDTSQLPVVPVRSPAGDWVRVRLPRAGAPVWLRAWKAHVGRVRLYLLDSNDPANPLPDRGITSQLYGGGPEMRLLQEMALGIGGMRLLRAIGIRPEVCHLNEGHSGFVVLERARAFMEETAQPFEVALTATSAGNVFTTHTPVAAGFDRFDPALVDAYAGAYAREELRIAFEDLLALGRARPRDAGEPFSMAWLAARGSGAVNAVSRRHRDVSRRIFQPLFPRWPEEDVPVGYVTNGVHVPSWDSAEADELWTDTCGPGRWRGPLLDLETQIQSCADVKLWAFRSASRGRLVDYVRERLQRQLAAAGVSGDALEASTRVLDHDALTLGLARRFVGYKRPTLLLRDPERLARLLADRLRPVQIVIAGKAHPNDEEGKGLVEAWVRFARRADMRAHVVFLADYDLRLAERLVQGVDLWINTPRPPWEACGTSGMKVLVNGGLNLSSVDGWWAEAYRPEVGWSLAGPATDDGADARQLYERLEREVIPAFYDRDAQGIPRAWVARMRASMATLTPQYSAHRAVREYTDRYYLPAAERVAQRTKGGAAEATHIVEWKHEMTRNWEALRFGDVRVKTEGGRHRFEVTVYVDDIDPDALAVELFAEHDGRSQPHRIPMVQKKALVGAHGYLFTAEAPGDRPSTDYTPRVFPARAGVAVPLELPLIAWPR